MENNSTPMYMPVAPAYGMGNGFGGGFGGDGWWILLLILFAGGGMWNGGFGGFGGGNEIYPWMNQADITTSGFQNQMLQSSITGVQNAVTSGFGDIQTALCGGFAGVNANIANGFAQAEIGANARQMADMNRSFDAQVATMQGFNGVQGQLAQCCCDNRLATESLRSTILSENCADRAAISDGIRDLLTAQTAGFQGIKDLLYQDRLDEKQDRIASLERQLTAAQLNASQIAQTSQITDSVYNRLATCPVGTVPVYGEQAIFRCNNNNGCGCGCNGGFAA